MLYCPIYYCFKQCSCLEIMPVANDLRDAICGSMELSGCPPSTYTVTCGYCVVGRDQELHTMVVITLPSLQEQIGIAVACAISEVIPNANFKSHIENGEVVVSITWTEQSPLAQAQALWEQKQQEQADAQLAMKLAQNDAQTQADAQMAWELSAQLNGGAGARVHSGGHGGAVAHGGAGARVHSSAVAHGGADGIQRSLDIAIPLKVALKKQGISTNEHKVSNTGMIVYITINTTQNPNMEPVIMAVTTVNPKAQVTCTRLDSKYTIRVSWPEPSLAEYF